MNFVMQNLLYNEHDIFDESDSLFVWGFEIEKTNYRSQLIVEAVLLGPDRDPAGDPPPLQQALLAKAAGSAACLWVLLLRGSSAGRGRLWQWRRRPGQTAELRLRSQSSALAAFAFVEECLCSIRRVEEQAAPTTPKWPLLRTAQRSVAMRASSI